MRFLCIAAVSALALGAAACGPRTNPALRTRLDCPARQGDLVRASVSADGKSCGYRSGDVEVALQLTPLTGDPQTTLSAIETSLLGPKAAAPAPAAEAGATASAASAASAEIQAGDAAKAAQEAREDAGKAAGSDRDWDTGHGRTVVIDKNGKHVEVNGEGGDQAHIDLPGGFRTVGYEAGGPKTGPLTVAVVRSRSDVDIHGHLEHDLRRLVRLNGGA